MMNTGTLSDPNDIMAHIQIIADLQLPVTVQSNNGLEVSNCRLLYQPSNQEHIFVRMPSQQCPDDAAVEVTYILHEVPFQFSGKVNGKAGIHNTIALLPIQPPQTIRSINRRTYIRTKFSQTAPIEFDLTIHKHNTIHLLAEDISAGGIGFFVPRDFNRIALASNYPIKFQLPGSDEILTRISIRNLRQLSGMIRIGCKFVSLDAKLRLKIIELVAKNETRKELSAGEPGVQNKACIVVDDQNVDQPLWPFLEESYLVQRNGLKNLALGNQTDQPELIILNLDAQGAVETLKSTRSNAHLRSLPLILASAKYAAPPFAMPEVTFVRSSLGKEALSDIIDQLVYEFRWSQKISQLNISCEPVPKVLLLDGYKTLQHHIIDELERRPYEISVINDDKDLINRFAQIDPDVILMVHAGSGHIEANLCNLMKINKTLKLTPKILVTANKALADGLMDRRLISLAMSFPVETKTLIQAIDSLHP